MKDRELGKPALPRTPNRLDAIDGISNLDEQMLSMIVSLTSEITILRARLDACERLLIQGGALQQGAVDGYAPDPHSQQERDAQRQHIIAKIFRPITEAAEQDAQMASRGA